MIEETPLAKILPNLPEDVQGDVHMGRGIARSLGRALAATILVGTLDPRSRVLDEALEAQDEAWTILADKVLLFVLDKEVSE